MCERGILTVQRKGAYISFWIQMRDNQHKNRSDGAERCSSVSKSARNDCADTAVHFFAECVEENGRLIDWLIDRLINK